LSVRWVYAEWDDRLDGLMQRFGDLMSLFNYLLLKAGGDVEQVFRWLEYLQQQGVLDADVDLEELKRMLEQQGKISSEGGRASLTPRGEQSIRRSSLEQVFHGLGADAFGGHRTTSAGGVGETLENTRPYRFGDPLQSVDTLASVSNAIRRGGIDDIRISEEDLEVRERESLGSCATVLLIDISHSMILYGEDRITPAKQVALALTELILTRYPKDTLRVAVFGDHAWEVEVGQIPYLTVGPYHTNTRAGLQLAQSILGRLKHANKQIFMITDGKPSAIDDGQGLYKNPYGLDPKIVARTLDEASDCRRHDITITTFMVTQDPYLAEFVEELSEVNRGRAYYSSLENLGEYMFTDYMRNRRRRLR
jgi:uncharacterized protein with von Willebrand factor type A (vWA) domain